MVRKQWLLLAVPVLTLGALLTVPSASEARPFGVGIGVGGYGYGSPYYGGYGYGSPYYGGYGYGSRFYGPSYTYGPVYGGFYSPGYSSMGYYDSYPNTSFYSPNYTYYPADSAQRNSYYNMSAFDPAASSSAAPDASAASIRVELPKDAELWFGDSKTEQTGADRSFISPTLDPNKKYSYDITAKWMNNGQEVKKTKTIAVHAGDRLTVSFSGAADQIPTPAPVAPAANNGPAIEGASPLNPPPLPRQESPATGTRDNAVPNTRDSALPGTRTPPR
jgi:uncharacterized protein (TIGR03000 family)